MVGRWRHFEVRANRFAHRLDKGYEEKKKRGFKEDYRFFGLNNFLF